MGITKRGLVSPSLKELISVKSTREMNVLAYQVEVPPVSSAVAARQAQTARALLNFQLTTWNYCTTQTASELSG